ncbi:acyl-CoA carboxylase epsilon subunit [Streptomyces phytophilus]|uniref:acyl-CoA carboxylase epsilon subunit n=1 Tax=Streptomyces phytophilus TaxID=722715 RepID=UPI0015F01663|nr:acyl-CoA carboxylase epsilon subunit [Streptomyces phytophilus]
MSTPPLIRIERGNATKEDLAALSTALLTRRRATAATAPTAPRPAPWHRPERTPAHRTPHTRPTPPNPRTGT